MLNIFGTILVVACLNQPSSSMQAVPQPAAVITANEPAKPAAEAEVEDVADKLARLKQKRSEIEKEIQSLETELAKSKVRGGTIPDDAIAKAGRDPAELGQVVACGELKVTLVSLSFEQRWFSAKKRFDLDKRGFVDLKVPVFGILVDIENTSKGRVVQPFQGPNMFGGRASVHLVDNWDNKLVEANLENAEYEIRPAERSDFVLRGSKVLPGKKARFLLVVSDPDVVKLDWFLVRLDIEGATSKNETETSVFFVPSTRVTGLADMDKESKPHKSD